MDVELNDPKVKTRLDYYGHGLWCVFRGVKNQHVAGAMQTNTNIDDLMQWCLNNGHADVVLSPMAKICLGYEKDEKKFYAKQPQKGIKLD